MNPTTLTRRIMGYRWLQVLLIILVIYSAAGFILVPALIKSQLPRRLAPLLHREVAVARVRANPFALSLTLDGFRVKDKDGSPWFGWERLYINMSAQTLFRFAPVFKEIRLEGFQARVVLDKHGDPTFADLLVPGPTPAKPAGNPPELRIQRLLVVAARVDFLDQATAQPFATTLGPLNFDLDAFRLSRDSRNPYAFSGRTERGETFGWQGHFYLEPLRSQGTFFVKNLYLPKYAPFYRDSVAFDLQGGTLDFKAGYEFQWGEGDHRFRIHQGEAGLDHLKAAEKAKMEPAVDVPELRVAGLEADLLESWAKVASLTVRDGRMQVQKDAKGTNLQRMAASRRPPEPAGAKPFRFDLDELRVVNQSVRFEDLTPRRPVRLDLDQIGLVVKGFSLDPANHCGLDLDMRWNGQGRIHASGQAAPLKSSGALDLQVDGLTLAPLTGYLDPALNAVIDSGRLGVKGHADFDLPATRFAFKGEARVDGFKAENGSNATFAWDSLRVGGIQAASSPMAVTLASIDWEGPSARYVLAAAAKPGPVAVPADARPAAPADARPAAPVEAKPAAPALKAEVGVFRIKRGGLTFLDRTVQPVAALSLDAIEGQVGRLSTDPAARASVDLRARVDGAAPLNATGTVNLLSRAAYTDLKLIMGGGGMDLSPLSPYAGHYMGYGIEKGKLELDLAYQVKEAQLQGENRIRMDQFTLGAATDSPDAVHVPVKLGLALLRDRHGVIDLDVPVRGDLSQPDFRLGKVIWHAVLNVFAKIATSPFTLIGKAFGGGETDLSLLAFQPGADAIDAQNGKVLETLAKGLFERPGLRLEMEGAADEGQDGPALKRAELEATLQKLKGQPLEPGERPKFLRQAFLEAFPKPKDPKEAKATPEPPPEDMEARLLARIDVDAAALKLLARRRVQAARDRLLQAGNVEEERIFIVDGSERAKKEGGSRVFFEIK